MNNLIWIHNNKATETPQFCIHATEYIARRNGYNGNPGLVVYINNSSTWQERWIQTGGQTHKSKISLEIRLGYQRLKGINGLKFNVRQMDILFGQSICNS
jgi:hypothetical protein